MGHECWHGNRSIMCNGDKLPFKKKTYTLCLSNKKILSFPIHIMDARHTHTNNNNKTAEQNKTKNKYQTPVICNSYLEVQSS